MQIEEVGTCDTLDCDGFAQIRIAKHKQKDNAGKACNQCANSANRELPPFLNA
jgi:hypothetical protein